MKTIMSLLQNLFSIINMGRTAHADEVVNEGATPTNQPEGGTATQGAQTPNQTNPQSQQTVSFEVLIAKARQEEKDKLYPEITRLKGEIEDKVKRVNELLLSLGEKDETISKLNSKITDLEKGSKKSESEEVKGLNNKIEELQNTIALKDSEIATLKIESYKKEKMNEAQGKLIPELVRGTTQEEIDATIELAKQRYSEILNELASKQPAQQTAQAQTYIPPVNPNTQQFASKEVNLGDLNTFNMMDKTSRAEYAKLRAQMGLK